MTKRKILYVTHEMTPYMEMTEMAFSARELPQKMQEKQHEVRVFMPKFGEIKDRKHRLHEVIRLSGINIPVGDDDNPLLIKVASLPAAKMQIYFLDNEDFFQRRGNFHDDNKKFFADNDERLIFFCKSVIEIILKLGWIPDIVHCQGWLSSLVPMYARTVPRIEPVFRNTKFIYTPFNNYFTETLGETFAKKGAIQGQSKDAFNDLQNPTCNDLYLKAVQYADGITFGHPEVDANIHDRVIKLKKPMLGYTERDTPGFAENHLEFYETLLEQKVLEKKS